MGRNIHFASQSGKNESVRCRDVLRLTELPLGPSLQPEKYCDVYLSTVQRQSRLYICELRCSKASDTQHRRALALARSFLSLTRAGHPKSAYIVAVRYIEDRHMLNIDRDILI